MAILQKQIKDWIAETNAEMQTISVLPQATGEVPIIYNRQAKAFFEFIVSGGSLNVDGKKVFATGDGGNTRRKIIESMPVEETTCLITSGPNITTTGVSNAGNKANLFYNTTDFFAVELNATTNHIERYTKSTFAFNTSYNLAALAGVNVDARFSIQVGNRIFVGNASLAATRNLIAFDTTAFTATSYALTISGSPTRAIVPLASDATRVYFFARTASGLRRFGRFNHTTNTFDTTFLVEGGTGGDTEFGAIDSGFLYTHNIGGRINKVNLTTWAIAGTADVSTGGGCSGIGIAAANGLVIFTSSTFANFRTIDQATLSVVGGPYANAGGVSSIFQNGSDVYFYGSQISVFNTVSLTVANYTYPQTISGIGALAFEGSNIYGVDSANTFSGTISSSQSPNLAGIQLPPAGTRKIIKGCSNTYLLNSAGNIELFINTNAVRTLGTNTAYTGTIAGFAGYNDNTEITIEPHLISGANPTININGLGARNLRNQDGSNLSSGRLIAGKKYKFIYNSTAGNFELSYQAQLPAAAQPQDVFALDLSSDVNIAGTYNNGTAGVGATLTGTVPGQITVDGVIPVPGDVILLTGQTDQTQNGPYVVQTNVPFAPFELERIPEFDETAELDSSYFYVVNGTLLSGTSRIQITPDPVIGTNNIIFEQASATITPTAPIEINVTGTTATVNRATANAYILDLRNSTGNVTVTMSGGVNGNNYTLYVIDHATTPRTLTFPAGTFGPEVEGNTYVADLIGTRYIMPFSYLATPLWGTRYQYSVVPNVG